MKQLISILFFYFIINVSLGQHFVNKKIFVLIKMENFDKAIEFGESRLKKLEKKGKFKKHGIPYLLGLGMAYEKLGDWTKAEDFFQQAYQLVQEKKAKKKRLTLLEYDVLDEVALFYLQAGNYLLSKKIINESEIARKNRFHKNNPLRYRYYLPKGLYFYKKHALDSAFCYFKKYILYIKNSNHINKLETNRLADAYFLLSKIEFERKNFRKSLKFAKKNKRYQNHRWTHLKEGKNNFKRIESFHLVAQNYRILQKHKKATKYNNKALKLHKKRVKKDTYQKVPLLTTKALIEWDLGNLKETEKLLLHACELQLSFIQDNMTSLTEDEKEHFYNDIKTTFDLLYAFSVENEIGDSGKKNEFIEKIYDFQLQTKGIILNETNKIYDVISQSKDSVLINTYQQWIHYKNELSQTITANNFEKVIEKTEAIELKINELEKILTKETALLSINSKNNTWKSIQENLEEDEVAIELIRIQKYDTIYYSVKKRKKTIIKHYNFLSDHIVYLALGIQKGQQTPQFELINNGNKLENQYASYYFNTIELEIEDTLSYYHYWKPILPLVGNKKTVYLSADGVYNLLNLGIIQTPQKDFLMDNVKIHNITNSKSLLKKTKKELTIQNATLLGRPQFNSNTSSNTRAINHFFTDEISDLPNTEKEVKNIAKMLKAKGIPTNILLGPNANEKNLKANHSCQILHISTHGFFNENTEEHSGAMIHSGLLLAQNNEDFSEDGILTAYEASGLNLKNTELVVLSACVTGLGNIKNGEGVYGLQRAFEVAGVHYVIMSLWNVDDKATQELMTLFYGFLLEKNDVYWAYQKAIFELRKKYEHPIYWGAFKLLGK